MIIKRRKRILINTKEITVVRHKVNDKEEVTCPQCGIHFNPAVDSLPAAEVEAYAAVETQALLLLPEHGCSLDEER